MAAEEMVVPAVSAVGGGITVGWIAKLLIQNWIKKNDENHSRWAEAIQEVRIQLTRIEERISGIQQTNQTVREHDRTLAVVQSELAGVQNDLNGLGAKVRNLGQ